MVSRSARVLAAALALTLASSPMAATKKKKAAGPPPAPSACVDLYGHANAAWLAAHPLPNGVAGYGRWDELRDAAAQQVRALVRDPTPGTGGPASRLLADLIASSQDLAAIDAAGSRALHPLLAQAGAVRKGGDVANAIAAMHAQGVPVLFGFDIERDAGTGQPRARFRPAGLGLEDPGFYTSNAGELVPIKGLYRAYVAGLLRSAGIAEAEATAQADLAIALENELAAARASTGGVQALPVKDAGRTYKPLNVGNFLKAQGLAATEVEFIDPNWFLLANQKIAKAPAAQWQAYLRVQVLQAFAPFLGGGVSGAYDRLFQGLLAGNMAIGPEERVALLVHNEAGELLSAAYAERHPGPAGRARAGAIADAVRAASDQALLRATWLTEQTRAAARQQLAAMRLSIGAPDVALPLGSLGFDRADYVGNVLKLRRWRHAASMARLATPVWPEPVSQTVPLVGFEAGQNRLIVTAATLQPPVLSGNDAADYGAFGALVAQQMAQDLRRLGGSDAQGFAARVQPLLVQFGKAPGGAPGGDASRFQLQSATDVGALDVAWQALNAAGVPADSDKKAFFLAWAGLWGRQGSEAGTGTAEALAYPPVRWRANAPALNHPAFAATFACKAGQPMVLSEPDRVGLWR